MSEYYRPIENPEDIPTRFAEAWNERDADKIAALFDEDADFVNVVGIWWDTREDIRKAHDYGLRVIFKDSDLKVTKTTVKFLSDDIAVVHARMRLKGQTPIDDTSPGFRFTIFTFVVHKTAEGWSCAAAQNTDIVPGKETNLLEDGNLKAVDYRQEAEGKSDSKRSIELRSEKSPLERGNAEPKAQSAVRSARGV